LVDEFGLAKQIRNVLLGKLHEPSETFRLLLELLDEFLLFLVAPRLAKRRQLARESAKPVLQVLIEPLEISGKLAKFLGVNNGLGHDSSLSALPKGGFDRPSNLGKSWATAF
jgi:hypothetical protein